ncbi:M23 family metallopeptidase [Pontibacillus yanchengensis]|nr:M23 family metallopeptidase [Pontibacillus yanchengensis]
MWMKKQKSPDTSADTRKPTQSSLWKKVVLTTLLGMGITMGSVYAQNFESQIPTVYHVYVDGEHIGTVDDQKLVKSYINEQVQKAEGKYEDLDLTIGEDVSYVPEKMFRPSFDNNGVMSSLDDELSIMVDATKLEVDGEAVGYTENQQEAEEAIKKLKAKYVPESILKKLEDPTYLKEKDLKNGDSTILDVKLSGKVSYSSQKVKPTKVLTTDELVDLLRKGTKQDKIHTVEKGEVLSEIASDYNLSTQDILELNDNLSENDVVSVGQEINVTDYQSYLDVIVVEEQKEESTIEFETEVKESDDMYKGEQNVKQEGHDGTKETQYKITKKNGEVVREEVLSETVTKESQKKIIIKGTKVIPSRGTGNFVWPTVGGVITSKQGWRWGSHHKGIDIAGVSDRTIKASDNGEVVEAGRDGGYGNKVVINHNNGYKTIYAHMSSIKVNVGQTVRKGQAIGVMGSTGHSTGTHLHFEVYKNGSLQNPLTYVGK